MYVYTYEEGGEGDTRPPPIQCGLDEDLAEGIEGELTGNYFTSTLLAGSVKQTPVVYACVCDRIFVSCVMLPLLT